MHWSCGSGGTLTYSLCEIYEVLRFFHMPNARRNNLIVPWKVKHNTPKVLNVFIHLKKNNKSKSQVDVYLQAFAWPSLKCFSTAVYFFTFSLIIGVLLKLQTLPFFASGDTLQFIEYICPWLYQTILGPTVWTVHVRAQSKPVFRAFVSWP